jgi:small subunit ribosomal protein S6
VETLTATFTEIVTANGGQVVKTESWGLRTLAYRIKKNRKGHYVLFNIDAPYAAVAELERNMGLNEDVLRFMTLRVDEHETEPSVVMQSKNERRDYDRRPQYEDRESVLTEEILA